MVCWTEPSHSAICDVFKKGSCFNMNLILDSIMVDQKWSLRAWLIRKIEITYRNFFLTIFCIFCQKLYLQVLETDCNRSSQILPVNLINRGILISVTYNCFLIQYICYQNKLTSKFNFYNMNRFIDLIVFLHIASLFRTSIIIIAFLILKSAAFNLSDKNI